MDTDEAIGVFLVIRDGHKAEIHYGIGQKFWQQGLMTEAGTVVMEWLMTQSGLQRIWSVCDAENLSSVRLLEKLNFKREGIFRKWLVLPACGDIARDCYMYARTWP